MSAAGRRQRGAGWRATLRRRFGANWRLTRFLGCNPDRRPWKSALQAVFHAICLALLMPGCGPRNAAEPEKDPGFERTTDRGPHSVSIRLDRVKPTVADRVNLELEVRAAEEWKVTWPVVKGKLGKEKEAEFQVVDQGESQPVLLPDGRTKRLRNYVLEPFLPGSYAIPAQEFRLEKPGAEPQRIETEEVRVEVRSVLGDQETADLHDIAPPVALREKGRWGWLGWLAGLGLLGAGGWWWWRHRRSEAAASALPPRPAHEIALEELDALEAQDLAGQGQAKRCYQELSVILRRYVENRFGVHAPGQTTEEFLFYQSRSGILEQRHQLLLKEFLQHCDLVKFAELAAGPEQVRKAFEVCRSIVSETKAQVQTGEQTVAAT